MTKRIPSSAAEHTPSGGVARADDVARLVLYFDVFRHPLRVDELASLVGTGAEAALHAAAATGVVVHDGRWVWRRGRPDDLARRRARAEEAERQWPRARRAAAFLARLPFVRGVLVTGALSKRSAAPDGDVDFLLLVAPGRVWTVKAGLHAIRRALPEAAREALCTNYLLATDALALPQRSMFHAVELATAVPMFGPEACGALLAANPWAAERVPGWAFPTERAAAAAPLPSPRLQQALEAASPTALEALGARSVQGFWARRYGWLPESERARRFQAGPSVATNHLHDFSGWVNAEYEARCAAEGVPS